MGYAARWNPIRGASGDCLRLVFAGRLRSPALTAWWLIGALAVASSTGCQAFFAPVSPIPVTPAAASAASDVPIELHKVTLPPYVIEPPDILLIDVVRMVPKPPHYIQPFDVLAIQVSGVSETEPIRNFYVVDEAGQIDLGPSYGSVQVADLSIEEARTAITNHLSVQWNPTVSVSLASSAIAQSIAGEHLVGADGQVNLGVYGSVYVAGMTIDQARAAIEGHLSKDLQNPQVIVEVFAYNSKKYWIITEGAGFGDNVTSRPIVGGDTVLDAISSINGISQFSSEKIYIARPAANGECEQILEVNWEDIKHGLVATDYQLFPGDRVIIVEDPIVNLDNMIGRMTRPWERLFGTSVLGAQAVQRFETFGNDGRNR